MTMIVLPNLASKSRGRLDVRVYHAKGVAWLRLTLSREGPHARESVHAQITAQLPVAQWEANELVLRLERALGLEHVQPTLCSA